MTISTTANSVTAVGNGSTTVFPFGFLIPYQSDGVTPAIKVQTLSTLGVLTTKVLTTDYTVSGITLAAGGSVTMLVAPLTGVLVVVSRNLTQVQPSAFPNLSLQPSSIETALDFITMWSQQTRASLPFLAGPYTVATLPVNPLPGQTAYVTDATAPTWRGTLTGGSTVGCPVFFDGLVWRAL